MPGVSTNLLEMLGGGVRGLGKTILETPGLAWNAAKDSMAGARGIRGFLKDVPVAASLTKDAVSNSEHFTASMDWWKTSRANKILGGTGKALGFVSKLRRPVSAFVGWKHADWIMKPAIIGAGLLGVAAGAGKATIQRSIDQTRMGTNGGMAPNNLGTDGLTLALSKRRHR